MPDGADSRYLRGTVLDRFHRHAASRPTAEFLVTDKSRHTFREVNRSADSVAAGLVAAGITAGDRVGVGMQNTPGFVVAVLGCWKAGVVVVPINPMYRARDLRHVMEDSGMSALFADALLRPPVEELSRDGRSVPIWFDRGLSDAPTLADLAADGERGSLPQPVEDVALLSYTSGTSGPAKGAINTHANLIYEAETVPNLAGLDPDSDRILSLAPMFHITGLVLHLVAALSTGCPLILTGRFDPAQVASLVERERPTFTVGSITAFIALLRNHDTHPADLSSLTKAFTGGAPVPPQVVTDVENRLGIYVRNAYGLTETTSAVFVTPLDERAPVHPAFGTLSVGRPLPGVSYEIRGDDGQRVPDGEPGELLLRGPQVVRGYWRNESATRTAFADDWFQTGDVAVAHSGWLYLVDRKKDVIIASGYKVWPREVEDVLYEMPSVREAAVVGLPDDYRGETVEAFVSLQDGATLSDRDLLEHCRRRLAAFKCPTSVHFLDELPKTTSGKILRRELRSGPD